MSIDELLQRAFADDFANLPLNPDGTIREEEAFAIEAKLFDLTGERYTVDRKHNVLTDHRVLVIAPARLDTIEMKFGFTPPDS